VEPTIVEYPRRRPAWGPFVLAAFIGLIVCSNVAGAVWARWVVSRPEDLLVLSSRNRYLALTLVSGVSVPAYVTIATLRLTAAFVVCHLIGRAYGEQALSWFLRYLGVSAQAMDTFHSGFHKAQWGLIPFFAGSNIIAVLTGVHRTPPRRLLGLLLAGIAARLALMWWLARTFEDQLVDFLEWLQRYQWWAVGLSIAAVVLINVRNLRRGAAR
jgi:hypothetical protein